MKKNLLVVMIVLALLVSMIPATSAFAASTGTSVLSIRNKTGAAINVLFINSVTGDKQYITLSANTAYYSSIASASYNYTATTACGEKNGFVNLTRKAQLVFSCNAAATDRFFRAH